MKTPGQILDDMRALQWCTQAVLAELAELEQSSGTPADVAWARSARCALDTASAIVDAIACSTPAAYAAAYVTPTSTSDVAGDAFIAGLERSGMTRRECACGTTFWTRDPLAIECPPCISKAIAGGPARPDAE